MPQGNTKESPDTGIWNVELESIDNGIAKFGLVEHRATDIILASGEARKPHCETAKLPAESETGDVFEAEIDTDTNEIQALSH